MAGRPSYEDLEQRVRRLEGELEERRELERRLRESEERFRAAFHTSVDAVNVNRLRDGRYVEANEGFLALTGYTREEVLGRSSLELAIWNDPADRLELVRQLRERGEVHNFQAEFRMKDGRVRTGQMSARVVELGGEPHILSVTRDVTEVQRAHQRLWESERRFRRLLEQAADAFFLSDLDGRFLDVNQRACTSLGFKRDELLGLRLQDISVQQDSAKVAEVLENVRKGTPVTVEDVHRRKDGTTFPVEVRVGSVEMAGEPLVLSLARDVTERRRAEEALAQSEERYRSLVEHTHDGYFMVELPSGCFLFLNQTVCDLFGYTMDEGLELTVWHVLAPEEHAQAEARFRQHLSGGPPPPRRTWQAVRKDGTLFRAEISASAVTFQGRPVIQGLLRDVTEHELLARRAQQTHKMEAVGTLASGIAHDFNNILQAISGCVEVLMRRHGDNGTVPHLAQIDRATQRAAELVKGLLAFSRETAPQLRTLDLNAEVRQAVGLLGHTIPKMIRIETRLAGDLCAIRGDPTRVEQILMNLATNARDAMPEGGTLEIVTENVTLDPAYVQMHPRVRPGRYVRLRVSDTGCGMSPRVMERIFEPFYSTKDVGKGTGLGLAQVYGIVESHGGHIGCESWPGTGTRFTVHFPATDQAASSRVVPEGEEPCLAGTERILLVDDEEAILNLVAEALTLHGYTVQTARSGEEALGIYGDGADVDLVVLDLGLPGMGGGACLRQLLQRDPGARVVVASGYSANGQARECLEAGARAFLAKPYRLSAMCRTVRAAMDRPRAEAHGTPVGGPGEQTRG